MISDGLVITGLGMAYIFAGLAGVFVLALILTWLPWFSEAGEKDEDEDPE